MAFAGPAPQRRVTVLFRILLAIPQIFVLWVLTIAAELVAIVGWFAALFTGRLPAGLAGFLTDWLRWSARAASYVTLLTDRYPPFEMADTDYPVRLSVAPGRLNRLAVLFRLILAFPVYLLTGLLADGGILIGVVVWLIVLIMGRMPESLYQAIAAVLRFGIRFYGYFFLLSGTYPGGLFGDRPDTDVTAAPAGPPADVPAADVPPAAVQPMTAQLVDGQSVDAPPGPGQPGYGQAPLPAGSPAGPQAWRLVLSSAAKRLVILYIAVGAVAFVGYGVLTGIAASHSASSAQVRVDAITSVSAAHTKLTSQLDALSQQISACQNQADALSCVTRLDRQAAVVFGAFGSTVSSTPMPPSATAAAAQLAAAADQLKSAFLRLGAATSTTQYEQIDSSLVGPKVTQFNTAYQNLGGALGAA